MNSLRLEPADHGHHDPTGSFYYELPFDEAPRDYLQQLWRACYKCQGLYYAGFPTAGPCPVDNGQHSLTGSFKYALRYGENPSPYYQDAWRACSKCQGLFYGGHANGDALRPNNGVCPAGGDHLGLTSFNYGLQFKTTATGPTPPPAVHPMLHLSVDNVSAFSITSVIWVIWEKTLTGAVPVSGSLSGTTATFQPPGPGSYILIAEVTANGALADFRGDVPAPNGQMGVLMVWGGADMTRKFKVINESGNPIVILAA